MWLPISWREDTNIVLHLHGKASLMEEFTIKAGTRAETLKTRKWYFRETSNCVMSVKSFIHST